MEAKNLKNAFFNLRLLLAVFLVILVIMCVIAISKTVFDRSNNKKILLLDIAEKLPQGKVSHY